MSEFKVSVVEIGKIERHENADNLSIVHIFDYPCVIRTGDFKEGDKAVYIPVDSLAPLDSPEFAFLRTKEDKPFHRVRAVKLRGCFSMGLLIPAFAGWNVGDEVRELLGIKKYEPPEDITIGGENEHCPFDFPKYTDIEGYRRWPDVLKEGETVAISEKIHGTSARFLYHSGTERLWVGSHNNVKRENKNNLYWKVAEQYKLGEVLKKFPDKVFFGEVYGWVQDLRYGLDKGQYQLRIFDVMNLKTGEYLNYFDFMNVINKIEVPDAVPYLCIGPWEKGKLAFAEDSSVVGRFNGEYKQVMEGIVIKPLEERFDDRIGRVILKYHSEQYLTRK